jgi:hypothetical protein
MYEFTCQLGALAPPPPEMLQLFEALRENQSEAGRFLGITAGTVLAEEFFTPKNVGRIIEGARRPIAA